MGAIRERYMPVPLSPDFTSRSAWFIDSPRIRLTPGGVALCQVMACAVRTEEIEIFERRRAGTRSATLAQESGDQPPATQFLIRLPDQYPAFFWTGSENAVCTEEWARAVWGGREKMLEEDQRRDRHTPEGQAVACIAAGGHIGE